MKKPILFCLISCVGLLTIGTSASLAWFTSHDILKVSYFDISFETQDDLKIATVDEDDKFTDKLEAEDLNTCGLFIPVSSMHSSDWMSRGEHNPLFYGQHDRNANTFVESDNGGYVVPKEVTTNEGFYSQEIFLKSSGYHMAYLDTSELNTYIMADVESNKARADVLLGKDASLGTKEEVVNRLNNLQNSMRISILVDKEDGYDYKIFEPYKSGTTLLGGTIDSECKGYFDAKSHGDHSYEILYGEVENRDLIKYDFNENMDRKSNPTWADSGHKNNTYVINTSNSINNGVVIHEEKTVTFDENLTQKEKLMNSEAADLDKILLIPLDAEEATRIVVSIYMEGWDVDNIDSTMGGSFNCNLTFGILDRYIA